MAIFVNRPIKPLGKIFRTQKTDLSNLFPLGAIKKSLKFEFVCSQIPLDGAKNQCREEGNVRERKRSRKIYLQKKRKKKGNGRNSKRKRGGEEEKRGYRRLSMTCAALLLTDHASYIYIELSYLHLYSFSS